MNTPHHQAGYLFDNASTAAADQVQLLAEILDDHTAAVLRRIGIGQGWHCLDLGTGAGTVAAMLAAEVGPTGRVTAVDTDPRHVTATTRIAVTTADVTHTDLGVERYHLIHARLLLMHLPQRETLVDQLAWALKPGGVLIVSDWDCTHLDDLLVRIATPQAAAAFRAFQHALVGLGADRGMSVDWAHHAPTVLEHHPLLATVEVERHHRRWYGGQPGCLLHASNSRQLEAPLRDRGLSAAQLDVLRAAMADPVTCAWSYPMVTTVARRAGTSTRTRR